MVANGTQQRTEKAYDFKPVDFDVETMEPDAQQGEYQALIEEVKVSKTSKDQYPMLILEWKLTETATDTEEAQKSVGASIADFIAFFPEGDRKGRMGKLRLRALNEKLGIDNDVLPKRIQSKADFKDYVAALKGQTLTIWITTKPDADSGEVRASVHYSMPKGFGGGMDMPSDDEEEAPPPRGAKAGKGKPAANARGRR